MERERGLMAYPLPRNGWTVTTHHPVVWDLQTERPQRSPIPGGRFFIFRIVLASTEANDGKKPEMPHEALPYPGHLGQNQNSLKSCKTRLFSFDGARRDRHFGEGVEDQ